MEKTRKSFLNYIRHVTSFFVICLFVLFYTSDVKAATASKTGLDSVEGYDFILRSGVFDLNTADISINSPNIRLTRFSNGCDCLEVVNLVVPDTVISVPGSVSITFKNAVLDSGDNYYNLRIILDNIKIFDDSRINQYEDRYTFFYDDIYNNCAFGSSFDSTNTLVDMRCGANVDCLYQVIDPATNTPVNGYIWLGLTDIDVGSQEMWVDSSLAYPNRHDKYQEGVTILSGLQSNVYLSEDSILNISSDGLSYFCSGPCDWWEEKGNIAFKGNASGTKIRWSGYGCGTGICANMSSLSISKYTVVATSTGPGTVSPASSTAFKGQNKSVLIKADNHAYLKSLKVDNTAKSITNSISMNSVFNKIQSNHTVHAVFEYDTYYVDYNSNMSLFKSTCPDKTIAGSTDRKVCYFESTYNHWDALTNSYYFFTSWKNGTTYTNSGAEFKNLASSKGAVIVETAQWKPKKYTIVYHANKLGVTGADKIVSSISVEDSGSIWTPESAYCRGYYIDHWNTKTDDTGTVYALGDHYNEFWYKPTTNEDDVINLYAIWKPYPYEVTYKAGDGNGTDVVETWIIDETHTLYNNTPNLSATKISNNEVPHFTKEGYYIDYWVPSFQTSVYETGTADTSNKLTGTGYSNDKAISKVTTISDLLIPGNNTYSHVVSQSKGFGEKVVLTAHWAPIQYKVTFYNDSTVPGSNGAPYTISSNTYTTDSRNFGTEYELLKVDFTRKNKYGISTFLGYCYAEGCIAKNPTFVVKGQSPDFYMSGRKTNISAASFAPNVSGVDMHINAAMTINGVSWKDYFKYLNEGDVQSFKLYAVWDDCPGIEPVDVEQQRDRSAEQFSLSTPGIGSNTLSGLDLEYYILHLPQNENTIWDREDDVSYLSGSKENYYIKNFTNLGIKKSNNVSSYKLTFVIKDSFGHTYESSRKLYSGLYCDIMLHDSVSKFSQ